jgi:hypothetical protein
MKKIFSTPKKNKYFDENAKKRRKYVKIIGCKLKNQILMGPVE